MDTHTDDLQGYCIQYPPYYHPVGRELEIFTAAYRNALPVLLKGPTGCGKTRFMEHMAWRLKRPLITVSCHDDLTAADLVGRYLITGGETVWVDGPLARAVRQGAICYLDEVVEARKDTTVVIHPLADGRRVLPMEKRGELLEAGPEFCLAMSYNPGYQSVLKDLKHSTRHRRRNRRPPRTIRAVDAQPERPRTGRRRLDPLVGAHRQIDTGRHCADRRLHRRHCSSADRRRRHADGH